MRRLDCSLRKDSHPGLVDMAGVRAVEGSEDAVVVAASVVPLEDQSEASAGHNTREEQKVVVVVVDLMVEDTERGSVGQGM